MQAEGVNPWFAKAIILASSILMVIIRAPHGQRSRGVKVVKSKRGTLEIALLSLAWLSFFIPLIWVVAPILAFADYPLRPAPLFMGVVSLAGACGSSPARTRTLARTGQSHSRSGRSINSSPRVSTGTSATRCIRLS
jgi:hypothetical protein